MEGSAEGGIRLFSEGCLLPSGEAEMRRATGGFGGEASGEAEIVLRLSRRPRICRASVLGRGLSDIWAVYTWRGFGRPSIDDGTTPRWGLWISCLIVFCVF